jgi:Ca-activated chloride channel family protein
MTLSHPLGLIALLAIPAVAGILWLVRRRPPVAAVRYTNIDVLAAVAAETRSYRRFIPLGLALAALAALAIALARPQHTGAAPASRATVVLVFDTSRSMEADDVFPTRLGAAENAAQQFLKRMPKNVQVGVVSFNTDAQVAAFPTTDRTTLENAILGLQLGFRTAIGDGLSRAVDLVLDGARQNGVTVTPGANGPSPGTIVLLSDGRNNSGLLLPLDVARRARSLHIPVYTVALGTDHGSLSFDPNGPQIGGAMLAPDPETLSQMAKISGGQFFAAPDEKRLSSAYKHLGGTVARVPRKHEITAAFVGGGAVLLVCAAVCSLLWRPRLP